jgi:catechol 2,3-dioxygenase-like lactoylglutathione lyase family enzyme
MTQDKKESSFTKVIQVGLVVKDVEKTVARLTALGIGPFNPMVLSPEREEWFRGKRMYADFKIYGARIGDVQIELIQPLSGDSPHKEFLETKGEGIQHIACAVDDVQKEADKLTGLGAEVLMRAKFPGGGGVAYMDLNAGGLIVELIQRRAPPPEAASSR